MRSHLSYCSQLWRPYLIKDIESIERVQRKATKYILNDYHSDYKARLSQLQLLPLMHWFEIQDILFLVKCLQQPTNYTEITSLVTFTFAITRAGQSGNRLKVKFAKTNYTRHFYFARISRIWNAIPSNVIDLSKTFNTIKQCVREFFYSNFKQNFSATDTCSYHVVCPCNKCHVI